MLPTRNSPLGSDWKPLRGCVTGRNFLQVSLLSSVGAASHAAREGAVRRRPYNKRIGRHEMAQLRERKHRNGAATRYFSVNA